jgi:hypothetical protein
MILSTLEYRNYTLVVLTETEEEASQELRSTLIHNGLHAIDVDTILDPVFGNCNHHDIELNKVIWT